MKSTISLILPLALLSACGGGGGAGLAELPPAPMAAPSDAPSPVIDDGAPPPATGPQGSSQARPGEERYDRVGHAGYADIGPGVYGISGELPAGSHAEVTALDTGRTILLPIRGEGQGLIELSDAAAKQLGTTGNSPVRVRRVTATQQDVAALAAGQPAPVRADAPPALLAGLRKRLRDERSPKAPQPVAAKAPVKNTPVAITPAPVGRPTPVAKPQPASPRAARGLFVQVAALSSPQRARALADRLGGVVRASGTVHRVQIGPYPNIAAANRARADVARKGFGDARVISVP